MTLSYRPNAFQNATVPTEPSPRQNIFRAFHPRPMSDYELRPPKNKTERRERELPYGRWVTADGTEYLFNRRYRPIWERGPGWPWAHRADPMTWVDWVDQAWFFFDGNAPWAGGNPPQRKAAKVSLAICEKALEDFVNGRPVLGLRRSWREEQEKLQREYQMWRWGTK
jgi:hypothetical protein